MIIPWGKDVTMFIKLKEKNILQFMLLFYVIFLSGCSCNRLFFFPEKKHIATPAKANIDYQDVTLLSKDGTEIHGWHLYPPKDIGTKGKILYLHGNAQNISTHIKNVYWLTDFGYEVFLLDYRGFGHSKGVPCLPGIIEDIEVSYGYMSAQNKDKPVFILGQSIGASLATYVAGTNLDWSLAGLILDSPFASYRGIAREKFALSWLLWGFQYPLSYLFSDEYSPDSVVADIKRTHILLFYSNNDIVVSGKQALDLYEKAKIPKQAIHTGKPHNQALLYREHKQQLLDFLNQQLKLSVFSN